MLWNNLFFGVVIFNGLALLGEEIKFPKRMFISLLESGFVLLNEVMSFNIFCETIYFL